MTVLDTPYYYIPEKSQAENLLEGIEGTFPEFEVLHSYLNKVLKQEKTSRSLLAELIKARFRFCEIVFKNSSQESFYDIYLNAVQMHVKNLLCE